MRFIDFKEKLKEFVLFSISDIRKHESDFDIRRLNEWAGKGYLKKIRRGFYAFSDIEMTEQTLFLIANAIYEPSYISLEMAFSLYSLIPEGVYGITSVTSRKTCVFATGVGNFIYRHVDPRLLFGYTFYGYGKHRYALAEMEKAVLDYIYLNPHMKNEKDFEGLRFNKDEFRTRFDMKKFQKYLEAFNSRALSKRVRAFMACLNVTLPK